MIGRNGDCNLNLSSREHKLKSSRLTSSLTSREDLVSQIEASLSSQSSATTTTMIFQRTLLSALILIGFENVDAFKRNAQSIVPASVDKEITLSMPTTVAAGCLLALNCGFLNGCCLSLPSRQHPVVAVTSAYTNAVLKSDLFPLQVVAAYAGGSAVASLFNPEPKAFKLSKSTIPVFALAALATYETLRTQQLPFAAFAAGLQNSVTSVHTANLVRSAHMSGLTSDLGTFVGQMIRGNKQNMMRAKVCASLLSSFLLGGYLAVQSSKSIGAVDSLWYSVAFYALLSVAILALQY